MDDENTNLEAPETVTDGESAEPILQEAEKHEKGMPEDKLEDKSDDDEFADENISIKDKPQKNKKRKSTIILVVVFLFLLAGSIFTYVNYSNSIKSEEEQASKVQLDIQNEEKEEKELIAKMMDITIKGNDLDEFDLSFLKLENSTNKEDSENIVYSPLSIKYALSMLSSGTAGKTKKQIDDVLGVYHFKTYTNSKNLSLANAFFVNTNRRDKIKPAYTNDLKNNYSAELIFDSFTSPSLINSWVSDKTFGLIKDLLDSTNPKEDQFYLANALAIDMEWINKIQTPVGGTPYSEYHNDIFSYHVEFPHEKAWPTSAWYINEDIVGDETFGATANKYDIINVLGEDNIRSTIQKDYDKWAEERREELSSISAACNDEAEIAAQAPDLDEYIETLGKHYGHISSSTDFMYYNNDKVTAFAKDLKTYDGTTLQYVAIKPNDGDLKKFIKNISAEDLNKIIKNLKGLDWDSYDDGYVTIINGGVENFNFQYDLRLIADLQKLGISDVFDIESADLSNMIDEKSYLQQALHSANFAFSNSGIKAGAVSMGGGAGNAGGGCNYSYSFEVPKKEIDLVFYNGFVFLVRDKDSGEIWFMGAKYKTNED